MIKVISILKNSRGITVGAKLNIDGKIVELTTEELKKINWGNNIENATIDSRGYVRSKNNYNKLKVEKLTNKQIELTGYIKWGNKEIGKIYNHSNVKFTNNKLNKIVSTITKGKSSWDKQEFSEFLKDRVISNGRRDIERLLFRMGLNEYDVIKIAEITYALNPKDLLWISPRKDMLIEEALNGTFKNIFKQSLDEKGQTINSPDGQNIKSYGISNGKYGIIKTRLNGVVTDTESEVAVYELGKLLGVKVCPAWFVTDESIFSEFIYDFSVEFLVHVRHYFRGNERTGDYYLDLINRFPKLKKDIDKMCILDFTTRQDDRHFSNIAIKNKFDVGNRVKLSMYPLYDNGRSLFYEDSEKTVETCIKDIINNCTSFGEIGTYYDAVEQISKTVKIGKLVNLDITEKQIREVLIKSGFKGYRLEGSLKWITEALNILRKL